MSKWIKFEETTSNPKTKVWKVLSNEGNILLGNVSWFGRWRKYAFCAQPYTVFEQDCLRDIANFIEEQTKNHRSNNGKQNKTNT